MTVVEALVIIIVVLLVYVVAEWALEEAGIKIPKVILTAVALLLMILFLVGWIPFPDLGIGGRQ